MILGHSIIILSFNEGTFTEIEIDIANLSIEALEYGVFSDINEEFGCIVMVYVIVRKTIISCGELNINIGGPFVLGVSIVDKEPFGMSVFMSHVLDEVGVSSSDHVCVSVSGEMEDVSKCRVSNPHTECSVSEVCVCLRVLYRNSENVVPCYLRRLGSPFEPSTDCVFGGESLIVASNLIE